MKQVYQEIQSGRLLVRDVPLPAMNPGMILVRVFASVVSAGTERSVVEFAQKGLFAKARSRPDLVRQVIDKARREGVVNAFQAATQKLSRPQSLGYSCAGTVIAVAPDVTAFRVGDRVACAGAGYANHAEVVAIPANLVACLPEGLNTPFEEAAFATIGSIAMHGLRLAKPAFGESVAIIGLGLIGQLAVQLACAAGCTVVGMDPNPARCDLARALGCAETAGSAAEFESVVSRHSGSNGADEVVITAASENSDPVELAGRIARSRARVVAVGAVGTHVPRKLYFEKELEFLISRSYGPGRYDAEYEEKGRDYPIAYVRWTENRNMQAFLRFVAERKVDVRPLITHRFSIEDAAHAYELISGKTQQPFLGVLLTYPEQDETLSVRIRLAAHVQREAKAGRIELGMIGCGNFAQSVLLPALQQTNEFHFKSICTANGETARYAGEKFGFEYCTTDDAAILTSDDVDTVVIATRHNLHAAQVISALQHGKNVFCEKPLCLNVEQLAEIVRAHAKCSEQGKAPVVMVGFNRRFAPMILRLREFLAPAREPLVVHCRVNGGFIPPENWVQDPELGGGRIVGELCHFVDLLQFLTASECTRVYATATPNKGRYRDDNLSVTLSFADGSAGSIVYAANGDKSFGKERIEAFSGGRSAMCDDYRILELVRNGRRTVTRDRLRQDKGHREECRQFADAIRKGLPAPIFLESLCTTTLATFAVQESLASGKSVEISAGKFRAGILSPEEDLTGAES